MATAPTEKMRDGKDQMKGFVDDNEKGSSNMAGATAGAFSSEVAM